MSILISSLSKNDWSRWFISCNLLSNYCTIYQAAFYYVLSSFFLINIFLIYFILTFISSNITLISDYLSYILIYRIMIIQVVGTSVTLNCENRSSMGMAMIFTMKRIVTMMLVVILSMMCMICVMMIEVRIITIFSSSQAQVGDPEMKRFRYYFS